MNAELKALAERIARLEDDKAEIASDIRDLKAEAKAQGYDPTVLAKVVRVMRMEEDKRKKLFEQAELFDTYLAGVGLLAEEPQPSQAERNEQARQAVAAAARTLTNPRHVVKPSEVQKIADRAAARSSDPPQEEKDHAAPVKPPDRSPRNQGGAALVAASSSEEDLDIPACLDRRGGALRC